MIKKSLETVTKNDPIFDQRFWFYPSKTVFYKINFPAKLCEIRKNVKELNFHHKKIYKFGFDDFFWKNVRFLF